MAIISTSDGRFGVLSNQGFRTVGRGLTLTDVARYRGQSYGINMNTGRGTLLRRFNLRSRIYGAA